MPKSTRKLAPIHPGEYLFEDFMEPAGLTANHLATELHVPANRIADIIRGRRAITADTALRLGKYFGNDARFWMDIQMRYKLERAEDRSGAKIKREVRPYRQMKKRLVS